MSELIDFLIVSLVLVAIGIYGLVVKRNAIRMLFSIEIIANAANLNLIAFSRNLPNAQGQVFSLSSDLPTSFIFTCVLYFGQKIWSYCYDMVFLWSFSHLYWFDIYSCNDTNSGQSAYVESYPWSQFGNFGLRL